MVIRQFSVNVDNGSDEIRTNLKLTETSFNSCLYVAGRLCDAEYTAINYFEHSFDFFITKLQAQ